jgi:fibronectin type 3 domain-containing protein
LTTSATVTGDANHNVTLLTGNAVSGLKSGCYPNTATNLLTGNWSGFPGTLNLGNSSFMCSNGVYELNPSATMLNLSLTMARADETLLLDSAITVNSFSITNHAVAAGTYTPSQLAALGYGGIFSGSGSLTINNSLGRAMNVAAAAGNTQVALTWQAVAGATGYVVKRGTSSGIYTTTNVTGNIVSYTSTSLANGTTYYFVVVATNGAASGANSVELSSTPSNAPPFAPPGLSAVATGNGQITLTWAASFGATNYNVYRSTASGEEILIGNAGANTNYVDNGLVNGTTYYYYVTAVGAGGESASSSEASIVSGIILEAVTGGAQTTTWNQGGQWNSGVTPANVSGVTYATYISTSGGSEGSGFWGVDFGSGRLRTQALTSGTDAFGGGMLIVASGSELLIKDGNASGPVTVNANIIFTNYNGSSASPMVRVGSAPSDVTLTGTITNLTDSYLGLDISTAASERFTVSSTIVGAGNITLLTGNQNNVNNGTVNPATNRMVGDLSQFNGTLHLGNGSIMCSNGIYELNPSVTALTNLALMLARTDSVVVLDAAITVRSFSIAGHAVSSGTYTPPQLQALGYGGIFAGGGSLTVTPMPPRISSFNVNGTTLAVSATNGSAYGIYYLLTSTNVALPLSQWKPVLTNTFDNNGNATLVTNVINVTNASQFYILQLK